MEQRHDDDGSPRRPAGDSRRWRRWLVRTLVVLTVLQGLYLAAANALLRTSAGQRLVNRQPARFQISWSSAWTFWPGRIHLAGVHLKSQSQRVRWELVLDRGHLSFSMPALALKRFSTRRIAGHGMEFRLLRRPGLDETGSGETASGETEPDIDALPQISGFPGPLAHPADDEPPPPRKRPWTLSLSGIEVDGVREVWIEDQRFVGDGRVRGGVRVTIRGPLEIEPSVVELAEGRITNGDEVVSENARLFVEARSDRFVPREHQGLAVLRFLSGVVLFESPRTGFGFLDGYFRKAPWLDVGGTGDVRVDVTVDHGRLTPGSVVTVDAREMTVGALGFHAAGRGEIHAEVQAAADGAGVETRLAAEIQDFEIDGDGAGSPLVRGSGFALVARGSEADLAGGGGHLGAEVTIPRSEVPDLRVFNAFLPSESDLRIQSGSGEFEGRLELDSAEQSASGELEVRGRDVALQFQGSTVVGDVRGIARLPGADLAAQRYDVSGSRIDLERFRDATAGSGAGEAGWWGKIELRDGELRAGDAPGVDAALAARIRDTGPLAAYLADHKPGLRWFEELLTVDDVTAEGRLSADPENLSIGGMRIVGEKLEILATALHLTRGHRDGLFFFKLGPLSAAVEIEGKERDWKLTRSRRWFERRAAELGGAVPADALDFTR